MLMVNFPHHAAQPLVASYRIVERFERFACGASREAEGTWFYCTCNVKLSVLFPDDMACTLTKVPRGAGDEAGHIRRP